MTNADDATTPLAIGDEVIMGVDGTKQRHVIKAIEGDDAWVTYDEYQGRDNYKHATVKLKHLRRAPKPSAQ